MVPSLVWRIFMCIVNSGFDQKLKPWTFCFIYIKMPDFLYELVGIFVMVGKHVYNISEQTTRSEQRNFTKNCGLWDLPNF